MTLYTDYLSEIENRKSQGLHPKPIEDAALVAELVAQITDSENTERSKIPHFRKGHFKMLRSDYYTHKKGQIIYITETMVKGKAKTVSTSTQIEEFDNNTEK